MAQIISLAQYKERTAERAVARYWQAMFDEPFDAKRCLSDMSPRTLWYLAEPGDESSSTLFSLIIGLSGYNEHTTFEDLDALTQSHILDIHLFLSDQIRFEMMHRLGWLDHYVGNQYPIGEMITGYKRIKQACQDQSPSLAKTHAEYKAYSQLFERDQHVFIRRLISSALAAFKQTHGLK